MKRHAEPLRYKADGILNPESKKEDRFQTQYLIQRSAVAEDKIDGSLNEAILKVMPALVIMQCVL